MTDTSKRGGRGREGSPARRQAARPSGGARLYGGAVRALSLLFVAIGVAVTARTLIAGGGPGSVGFVLGIAFVLVGVGRLWAAARMAR